MIDDDDNDDDNDDDYDDHAGRARGEAPVTLLTHQYDLSVVISHILIWNPNIKKSVSLKFQGTQINGFSATFHRGVVHPLTFRDNN